MPVNFRVKLSDRLRRRALSLALTVTGGPGGAPGPGPPETGPHCAGKPEPGDRDPHRCQADAALTRSLSSGSGSRVAGGLSAGVQVVQRARRLGNSFFYGHWQSRSQSESPAVRVTVTVRAFEASPFIFRGLDSLVTVAVSKHVSEVNMTWFLKRVLFEGASCESCESLTPLALSTRSQSGKKSFQPTFLKTANNHSFFVMNLFVVTTPKNGQGTHVDS